MSARLPFRASDPLQPSPDTPPPAVQLVASRTFHVKVTRDPIEAVVLLAESTTGCHRPSSTNAPDPFGSRTERRVVKPVVLKGSAVESAFYSGWDATGGSFVGGYSAHYALGNTRQYTGWYGQAYYQLVSGSQLGVGYDSTFWDLVNQVGSIGPGASGSGVYDPNNRLVGTIVQGVAQSSQADSPGVCHRLTCQNRPVTSSATVRGRNVWP